jgi:ParB-like chromosome segregation protein Spo0J
MTPKQETFATINVVYVKTADLVPYIANSRTHSDEQVAQIAASIKEFGFTNPILTDGDNGIIAGHGRLMAARKLGLAEVPTIALAGLTAAQKRAYVIADNKLALNAGWDYELLSSEITGLENDGFDLSLLGFDESELGNILLTTNFEPGCEDDQGQLDQLSPQMVICPHCQSEFDARAASA